MRGFNLKNDIAIIPNGIDLLTAPPTRLPPWDKVVGNGRKVLLFLGRIHPKKGIPNLLTAWAQIQKSGGRGVKSEWVLAIAGWDQAGHEAELKRLASDLGLPSVDVRCLPTTSQETPSHHQSYAEQSAAFAPSVVFLGPQFNEAKGACYHFSDAFVLPSFSEGVPTVILEAWARSKPVVMTPQCNLPPGFSAGAALRIETNPASIAEGLRELIRMTDGERVAMGERGRALVADQFAWPKIAHQMKAVYEWMLGGGPKPACLYAS
jgi:poly(glycerol-phosphate) alpha-glucosyltransferase